MLPGSEVRSEGGPPENNEEMNGKKLVKSKASFVIFRRAVVGVEMVIEVDRGF